MDKLKPCPYTDGDIARKLRSFKGICAIPGLDDLILWAADIIDRRPAPENKPLTLEQLRQMDGKSVRVIRIKDLISQAKGNPIKPEKATVKLNYPLASGITADIVEFSDGRRLAINGFYEETWIAYDEKQQEQAKENSERDAEKVDIADARLV